MFAIGRLGSHGATQEWHTHRAPCKAWWRPARISCIPACSSACHPHAPCTSWWLPPPPWGSPASCSGGRHRGRCRAPWCPAPPHTSRVNCSTCTCIHFTSTISKPQAMADRTMDGCTRLCAETTRLTSPIHPIQVRVSGRANTPSWVYRRRLTGRLWNTASCLTAAPITHSQGNSERTDW